MSKRLAIVEGVRTPFLKAGGKAKGIGADDLGTFVVRELLARSQISKDEIDEVIFGNVIQPIEAANIARVIALKARIPKHIPAFSVQRNCASGMEAITTAGNKIAMGQAKIILAGGAESMSQAPLLFNDDMKEWMSKLFRARSAWQKLALLLKFRPGFLKPIIGLQVGLTDPVCGMIMGATGDLLAREFSITREEQDTFALHSHQKAIAAREKLSEEIIPIPLPPEYQAIQTEDDGPRSDQSMKALAKLQPFFDRAAGTVTVGNACPVTDGAAAVFVMSEDYAKERGFEPLGYVRDAEYAALEGARMGLGPVYATAKLMEKGGYSLSDFDTIEMNEAFAVQVLANVKAFSSKSFANEKLGRTEALGEIDLDTLNVNGGAIAVGHPVGATGTRLIITMLRELRRRKKSMGLATLCVGGGQGAALALEVE